MSQLRLLYIKRQLHFDLSLNVLGLDYFVSKRGERWQDTILTDYWGQYLFTVHIFNGKDGTRKPVKCTAQTVGQHRTVLQMNGEESPTSQDNINCMEKVRHVKNKIQIEDHLYPSRLCETLPQNQRTVSELHLSGTKRNIVNIKNTHFEKDSHYIYNSCSIVFTESRVFPGVSIPIW